MHPAWKLAMEASKTWRRLTGYTLILKLYDPSITFVNGEEQQAA